MDAIREEHERAVANGAPPKKWETFRRILKENVATDNLKHLPNLYDQFDRWEDINPVLLAGTLSGR